MQTHTTKKWRRRIHVLYLVCITQYKQYTIFYFHQRRLLCFLFISPIYTVKYIIGNVISKPEIRGFPGGAVDKNLPANAGDTGSIPGPGGSHMPWSNWARVPQLLSLCSRACAPQLLRPKCHSYWSPWAWSPCSTAGEDTAMRSPRTTKSGLRSPQLEEARAQQRRPNAAKNKQINKKKKPEIIANIVCWLILITL